MFLLHIYLSSSQNSHRVVADASNPGWTHSQFTFRQLESRKNVKQPCEGLVPYETKLRLIGDKTENLILRISISQLSRIHYKKKGLFKHIENFTTKK